MEKDMLKDIFHPQERFDRSVVEKRGLNFSQEVRIQKEVLAIMSELAEILNEVSFKM